jgi:hypothetical protein
MHRPGYVQGGQEASIGCLLLGIYHRRIPGDTDPDIPFMGIFVPKFRYFVFAVQLIFGRVNYLGPMWGTSTKLRKMRDSSFILCLSRSKFIS